MFRYAAIMCIAKIAAMPIDFSTEVLLQADCLPENDKFARPDNVRYQLSERSVDACISPVRS